MGIYGQCKEIPVDNLWVFRYDLWLILFVTNRMLRGVIFTPIGVSVPHILALDQGTSSSRAVVYNEQGDVLAQAQQTFDLILPAQGWVELDPEVIWQTTLACAKEVLSSLSNATQDGSTMANVVGIGITNQRETTIVWDRQTGACIYNAIVWQDSRTAQDCEALRKLKFAGQPFATLVSEQTGLVIDPYFSSTKLKWILDNVEGARKRAERGELCFGTVDSFLIWRLTGGAVHATDATNASRTQLFDIQRQEWSSELIAAFEIPFSVLPEVKDCVADYGSTAAEVLGATIPILGVAGDQQAALIGQGCFASGQTKSTYGTGCFVVANTGTELVRSSQKLLSTVGYRINGETTYALEGSIFIAGAGVKWLRDGLGLISDLEDTERAFVETGGDTGGVYFVPALAGLGAPYWQPTAKGLITGLTLDSTKAQVVTALLQAVVFQTEELLRAMRSDGARIDQLRVDGGMVVNDPLCQFLADILNIDVLRPSHVETTVFGAAVLAGIGAGLYADLQQAADAWQLERKFSPTIDDQKRKALIEGYRLAVGQVLTTVTQ